MARIANPNPTTNTNRVRAKADSIKQRLRERREYEDVLKEAAELTLNTEPKQPVNLPVKQLKQGDSPTDVKQGAEGEEDLRSIDS